MSLEQQLQQAKTNQQGEIQLAKLQQEFQQMKIEHKSSLVGKEAQIQSITDLHKDDPKIDNFVTRTLGLNSQLTHQKVSQWNSHCKTRNKLTSQVVEM